MALSSSEKLAVSEAENGHDSPLSQDERTPGVDLAREETTMASFSHLDEKKILRKVSPLNYFSNTH